MHTETDLILLAELRMELQLTEDLLYRNVRSLEIFQIRNNALVHDIERTLRNGYAF